MATTPVVLLRGVEAVRRTQCAWRRFEPSWLMRLPVEFSPLVVVEICIIEQGEHNRHRGYSLVGCASRPSPSVGESRDLDRRESAPDERNSQRFSDFGPRPSS
jgi:hypothetical protein